MNGKRILPDKIRFESERLLYLKQVYTYNWVRKIIPLRSLCLDLGCGEGYGTKILSSGAQEITGVDIEAEVVNKASYKYASKNCLFKQYDGKKISFPENTFDVVVSFQVIEHVKDDFGFISEAHRVLKKGGMFILATPNKDIRLPKNQKPWNIHHVREYSLNGFKGVLKNSFSEVEILGIQAVGKVKEIEQERIRQNLKIISWDFLNLRRILPKCIVVNIVRIVHLLKSKKNNPEFKSGDFLPENADSLYKMETQGVENALDIVGVCRK
ncbi:MAG: class I SAM-dependent methyltransferase [Candidatus Saelkia tenebricola]|nr:class I SAM-dependent methyltransferase [Candidatus Saelkia tenebricola]